MTNDVKIGERCHWRDAPVGSMVRRRRSDGGSFFYERISEACGWCVGSHNASGDDFAYESVPDIGWPWVPAAYDVVEVDIVALGLTGQETAAELQQLAEVFEVREELMSAPRIVEFMHASVEDMNAYDCPECSPDEPQAWTWAAKRLHRAGWRPGMTAEVAARMLAEAGR